MYILTWLAAIARVLSDRRDCIGTSSELLLQLTPYLHRCIHEACKSWSIHYGAQDWLSDHSLQSGVAVELFARVFR